MTAFCIGCNFSLSPSAVAVRLNPSQITNLVQALDRDLSQVEFRYSLTLCRDCFPLMAASVMEGMKPGGAVKRVTLLLDVPGRSNRPTAAYLLTRAGERYYLKVTATTYGFDVFLPFLEGSGEIHIFQPDTRNESKIKETVKRIAWADRCDFIGPNGWPVHTRFRSKRLDWRDRVLKGVADRLKCFASTKDTADAPNLVPFMFFAQDKDEWTLGQFRADRRHPQCEILDYRRNREDVYCIHLKLPKDMLWIPVDELIPRWRQVKALTRVLNRHWDAIHARLWAPPDALMAKRGWREVEELCGVKG